MDDHPVMESLAFPINEGSAAEDLPYDKSRGEDLGQDNQVQRSTAGQERRVGRVQLRNKSRRVGRGSLRQSSERGSEFSMAFLVDQLADVLSIPQVEKRLRSFSTTESRRGAWQSLARSAQPLQVHPLAPSHPRELAGAF